MGRLIAKPGLKQLILSQYGTLEEFSYHIGYTRYEITKVHQGKIGASDFLAFLISKELGKELEELFVFEPFFKPYLKFNIKKMYESMGYDENTFCEALGVSLRTLKNYRRGNVPVSVKLAKRALNALQMDDDLEGKDFHDMFEWCYKDINGNLIIGGNE